MDADIPPIPDTKKSPPPATIAFCAKDDFPTQQKHNIRAKQKHLIEQILTIIKEASVKRFKNFRKIT